MISPRARTPKTRGQSLTEFAIVAPALFLFLFGIIEAGRFIYYYHSLNNAVREGARYAIVHGSNALDGCPSGPPYPQSYACDPSAENVRQTVVDAAFGIVAPGALTFDPLPGCVSSYTTNPCYENDSNLRGNTVTLRVDYAYPPLLWLLPDIPISAETRLVINN